MRGMGTELTIGERIAWYRRRRSLSQQVLANLVDRTEDWLNKVENNRIQLDRLSVITALARELDITLGDLLAEPSLVEWSVDTGRRTVPELRKALLTYRQLIPARTESDAQPVEELVGRVSAVWEAYQDARFGYTITALPGLVSDLDTAVRQYNGAERLRCQRLLALTYQAATGVLTKVGEADLACVSAQRGYDLAEQAGERVVLASLTRSVTHALLAAGRFDDAVQVTSDASSVIEPLGSRSSRAYISVYGTLFLTGAMAAARAEDRSTVQSFLEEADEAARRLRGDDNLVWTAFGPTNVAIHRVATAMELGDVKLAIDLGARIDVTPLPVERRVRHSLEVARAYSATGDRETALGMLLAAERDAPEQVRHHSLSRDLVLTWLRRSRGVLAADLEGLAARLKVL
jgi:transcriptional regulator with XRE-family HTH domain